MSFNRELLPDPVAYFEAEGVPLKGPGKCGTGPCHFHGGSDSFRAHRALGWWVCMSCDVKGGDVLSYHMQRHGLEFVEAARQLGAWTEDGKRPTSDKPAPLPPRAALQVLAFESTLTAVAAGNVARGVKLSDQDRFRLLTAAARINRLVEAYQ